MTTAALILGWLHAILCGGFIVRRAVDRPFPPKWASFMAVHMAFMSAVLFAAAFLI